MITLSLIQKIAVWALPVLFAITLHEAAHAWVANKCGDTTAKMLGRLSLNPFRHIDLFGTILAPLFMGILTQFRFVFGWAKPVPINWTQLRKPRRDMALVALAGPLSNLIMVLFWCGIYKLGSFFYSPSSSVALFLILTAQAGILINFLLAYLNLIPIPPLDGSRVITSILPNRYAYLYSKLEPYGFFILLTLLFTGLLGKVLTPLLQWSLYYSALVFDL